MMANFKEVVASSKKDVVALVKASWCSYCKSILPIFEEISIELAAVYEFIIVDVDENPDVPKNYKVTGFPTIICIRDGVEMGREVGFKSKEALVEGLKNHFNK